MTVTKKSDTLREVTFPAVFDGKLGIFLSLTPTQGAGSTTGVPVRVIAERLKVVGEDAPT